MKTNKILLFAGFLCLFSLAIVISIKLDTFSNNLTSENLTLSTQTICYQETANISNSCGGLSTGVYAGATSNCEYDGSWDSCGSGGILLVNYTKPSNIGNNNLWQVKANGVARNITITSDCLNYYANTLSLNITTDVITPSKRKISCFNGTWKTIDSENANTNLDEEAMLWDYGYRMTRNLTFPKHINFTSAFMNLSGFFYSNKVYKLNPDVYSADTNTPLNCDGGYGLSCTYDNDYGTFAMPSSAVDGYVIHNITTELSTYGINFTFGEKLYQTSSFNLWCFNSSGTYDMMFKGASGWTNCTEIYSSTGQTPSCSGENWNSGGGTLHTLTNVTLPLKCLVAGQQASLKFQTTNTFGPTQRQFHESDFVLINNTFPISSYLLINQTKIWEYNNTFNVTKNITNNFASTLNSALNNGNCDCSGCTSNSTSCQIPFTFNSQSVGILEYSDININYIPIPQIDSLSPANTTSSSINKTFTCNSSDLYNLKNITLYVWNSSSIYNSSMTININGTTNSTTFPVINFSRSDTYHWNCLVNNNESYSNWFPSNYTLFVDTSNPATNLNYPTNNLYLNSGNSIDFNCTTDGNNLDKGFLYGNFTGNYLRNQTQSITSGTLYNFKNNLSDGIYLWTCGANKTSDATITYSASGNYTLTVDTIKPVMNDMTITTTINSNQFTFLSNITDTNMGTCKYSILNGATFSPNFTFSCNVLTSASDYFGFGTYQLYLYSTDLAGNENVQNLSFTTSISSGTIVTGGGGGLTPLTQEIATNFSILNSAYGNTIDISLAKNSVCPREKDFIIVVKSKDPIKIVFKCDGSNTRNPIRNICDYVKFSNQTLTVSPNEGRPTTSTFKIYTPESGTYGDNYYFNILAYKDSENSGEYSKLSVTASVDYFSTFLYKCSAFGTIDETKTIPSGSFQYPVLLASILSSILIFALIFSISIAFNYKMTGFLLAVIGAGVTFLVTTLLL